MIVRKDKNGNIDFCCGEISDSGNRKKLIIAESKQRNLQKTSKMIDIEKRCGVFGHAER